MVYVEVRAAVIKFTIEQIALGVNNDFIHDKLFRERQLPEGMSEGDRQMMVERAADEMTAALHGLLARGNNGR